MKLKLSGNAPAYQAKFFFTIKKWNLTNRLCSKALPNNQDEVLEHLMPCISYVWKHNFFSIESICCFYRLIVLSHIDYSHMFAFRTEQREVFKYCNRFLSHFVIANRTQSSGLYLIPLLS